MIRVSFRSIKTIWNPKSVKWRRRSGAQLKSFWIDFVVAYDPITDDEIKLVYKYVRQIDTY